MGSPVVGVVGGGQLARMLAEPALALDIELRVLASGADDSAARAVAGVSIGAHDDMHALRAFAAGLDALTFDHEHVPTAYLEALEAGGVVVRPSPAALVHAQDKLVMRRALAAAGIPCPRWAQAESPADVADFAADAGWPVVLKTPTGGYDGRGVRVVRSAADLNGSDGWFQRGPVLVEERVPFARELAAVVARSPHGQAVAYPVVETVQMEGMCREVVAPAPITDDHAIAAQGAALRIAGLLGVTGLLAVEMFDTPDGVLVNELAMRPHNSGHWSIDGAVTSQFENHLRAILDWPLGSPAAIAPAVVMVNVLGGDYPDLHQAFRHVLARDPGLRVHLYGKQVRPGRKVGHVTVMGTDARELLERGRHAAGYLRGEITE